MASGWGIFLDISGKTIKFWTNLALSCWFCRRLCRLAAGHPHLWCGFWLGVLVARRTVYIWRAAILFFWLCLFCGWVYSGLFSFFCQNWPHEMCVGPDGHFLSVQCEEKQKCFAQTCGVCRRCLQIWGQLCGHPPLMRSFWLKFRCHWYIISAGLSSSPGALFWESLLLSVISLSLSVAWFVFPHLCPLPGSTGLFVHCCFAQLRSFIHQAALRFLLAVKRRTWVCVLLTLLQVCSDWLLRRGHRILCLCPLCPPVLWLAAERTQDPVSSSHQPIIWWIKTLSVKNRWTLPVSSSKWGLSLCPPKTPLRGGHTAVSTKIFTDKC